MNKKIFILTLFIIFAISYVPSPILYAGEPAAAPEPAALAELSYARLLILSLQKEYTLVQIPSGSMENTVATNTFLLIDTTAYVSEAPSRYDIVLFTPPDYRDTFHLKRIIGLPGEQVTLASGAVFIDGHELREPYVENWDTGEIGQQEYTVPDNAYFVLGDNRDASLDSRHWEQKYIPLENILGKAVYIGRP